MMMIPSQSCIFTLYLFFLVLLVLHTLASPTFQYCRHDQRDALLEFKHDFSVNESNLSPYNASLSSWNKSSDCCFWEGVTCDTKSGEVISLDLDFISLNTSLKPNSGLFKLQHLQNLSLGTCNLYGEIPSSLGNLSRLTRLDLWHNQLVGEVPSLVGNLNQLKELWLHTNSLSGNIPISFTNLTKLTVLVLSNNQFIGGDLNLILPNLTTLSFLNLAYNYFKSTLHSDMSGLRSLKFCNVGANSFFGPIPTSLFTIPLLEMLMLEQNQLEGPIEFRNMSSSFMLRYLKLCYNNFTGPLPKSIFGFVNLELLDLSSNKFIGPIPRSISKLLNLKFLRLSNNKLVGEEPSYLWGLEEVTLSQNSFGSFETLPQILDETLIQVLDLHSNSFREPFPYWICKFRSLKLIDFSNNLFSGSIPSCVRNFTHSLVVLRLRNNTLRGITPDIFANATYLKALDVSHNKLEGKLPKSLINCKAMQLLSVRSNKIKDTFPSWLGSLPSLHVLILSSNKFYGAVDHSPTLTGFQSLKVMDISHNDFIGTLPPHLFSGWSNMTTLTVEDDKQDVRRTGNFTNMEGGYMFGDDFWTYFGFLYQNSMTLVYKGKDTEFQRIRKDYCAIDFSENRFSGHIPESIGFLKALRFLNLSGNAFTSNIPQSLANLTMLEALDLSRNQLSGQIPQDLGSLAFLSTINFSHNNLQGLIPRGTQFQSQNCSSFMDNPKLDGLEELCDVSYPTPQQNEELSEGEEVINWIAAAIAYGPGVFCGLVIGHIFIASHKYEWFMEKFSRNKP